MRALAVARNDSRTLAALGIALTAALVVALYHRALLDLVLTWLRRDDYSHGFLIPFLSAYLIARKRSILRETHPAPRLATGTLLCLAAGAFYIGGLRGGLMLVQQLSFLSMLGGLVVLLLGYRFFLHVLPALAYLLFAVPLFDPVAERLSWPLQLFSARLGAELLRAGGVPVFHQAQYLALPGITLEVAEVCSGLRFLVSIAAIGIFLAAILPAKWWKRVLLVVLGLLTGVLANGARIALIGLWAHYGKGTVVHGPLHAFQGLSVSFAGYLVLFGVAWRLARSSRPDSVPAGSPSRVRRSASTEAMRGVLLLPLAVGLLVLAATGALAIRGPIPVHPGHGPAQFPVRLGDWVMTGEGHAPSVRVSAVEYEISRSYALGARPGLELYVGYLASQEHGRELASQNLRWLHEGSEAVRIALKAGEQVMVNKLRHQVGGHPRVSLFWYYLDGSVVPSRARAILLTALRGAVLRRNDGALIIVSVPLEGHESEEAALRAGEDFIRELLPELGRQLSPAPG